MGTQVCPDVTLTFDILSPHLNRYTSPQILLGNPICVIVFVASLQYFFSTRVASESATARTVSVPDLLERPLTDSVTAAEERYLVKFFGQQYEDYRRRVPSRIPFVP